MLSITNISAYRFIRLPSRYLLKLKKELIQETKTLKLKGTVLLSTEGINLFLSGSKREIIQFKNFLTNFKPFKGIIFKESFSTFQPFNKILIKIKKEIIPFGIDSIRPEIYTAPSISPESLKNWLMKKSSQITLLDTRNDFEIKFGSFEKSMHLNLKCFRNFPKAMEKISKKLKETPIVTFCTGGIRCEKASAFLLKAGFQKVYQLEGGILNYFEKCGDAYYQGLCFVFDNRIAVTPSLTVA